MLGVVWCGGGDRQQAIQSFWFVSSHRHLVAGHADKGRGLAFNQPIRQRGMFMESTDHSSSVTIQSSERNDSGAQISTR